MAVSTFWRNFVILRSRKVIKSTPSMSARLPVFLLVMLACQ